MNGYPDSPRISVRAYLLFFIITTAQVGVGGASFQRKIYKMVGQDSWVTVLIAGLFCHLVIVAMFSFLKKYPGQDLYGIQKEAFGKWLGGALSFLYVAYLILIALTIIRNYAEIVQTWIFPDMPPWFLALMVLALALYGVLGGIRVIAGIGFVSVLIITLEMLLFYYPLQYADWGYLLPVMNHSPRDFLKGTQEISFSVVGFELLMFVLPFIRDTNKAPRYAHFAIVFTMFTYLVYMFTALVYFSGGQLIHTIWPTLTLLKIVEFPFIERVEYITVSLYLIGILPNVMLYVWSASRGIPKMSPLKEKASLYLVVVILFVICTFFSSRLEIRRLNEISGQVSIYMAFAYPLLLSMLLFFKRRGVQPPNGGDSP
ncbi:MULTISPECIES: GerAB/ArcD/ProY family transporter [unclassified Paenibacillus]|uniref:GerAB/ArcD/ProY family transporter n=1 Tax=unclassified Paenibacillus TaxID=185978 RepID=UPI00020D7060|nr:MULTISPECIES: GerAB/ArcD/ProY family transporter [unclassified Paenibacillus]EGL18825.1 spore germination protein (amino acid permease) [Paenibacillus sp. HGF7]EPD92717.1 spore germination protein (amino acid permease) [Paenibacillus sp. HGH0039]